MRSPFFYLHFRPWLQQLATQRQVSFETLLGLIQKTGDARWHAGHWTASYDWGAIVRDCLDVELPFPRVPSLEQVLPFVLPGASQGILRLRRLPVRLALITNGYAAYQTPFLRPLGWDFLFDALVTTDSAQTAKPDAAMWSTTQPLWIHIGDRVGQDALGAVRAGGISVLVGSRSFETSRNDPLAPTRPVPSLTFSTFSDAVGWVIRQWPYAESPLKKISHGASRNLLS